MLLFLCCILMLDFHGFAISFNGKYLELCIDHDKINYSQ